MSKEEKIRLHFDRASVRLPCRSFKQGPLFPSQASNLHPDDLLLTGILRAGRYVVSRLYCIKTFQPPEIKDNAAKAYPRIPNC